MSDDSCRAAADEEAIWTDMKILVVDDESRMRKLVRDFLAETEF